MRRLHNQSTCVLWRRHLTMPLVEPCGVFSRSIRYATPWYLVSYVYSPTLGIGHTRALQESRSWTIFSSCPHEWPHLFASRSCLPSVVFWSASLPFPLWVPEEGISGDIGCIANGVTSPSPTTVVISSSAGCCFVYCHSSRLLKVFDQQILRINPRQVFLIVRILFMVVAAVLQVSAP